MPSYKDHFPDKWLRAEHLQSKRVTVTVASVEEGTIFNPLSKSNEKRIIASFTGKDLRLIINKSQAEALATIFDTEDYSKWKGAVTLSEGRAPNGKATVVVSAAPSRSAAPATVQAEPALVHGPAAAQVHGRLETQVHGPADAQVHGRDDDLPDDPEDDNALLDALDEEGSSAVADPKSDDVDLYPSPKVGDQLFFSASDLEAKVRELHGTSGPMTAKQHDYVIHMLGKLTVPPGRGEEVMSRLIGRPVTANNVAGAEVGLYLYKVVSESNTHTNEYSALLEYIERMKFMKLT